MPKTGLNSFEIPKTLLSRHYMSALCISTSCYAVLVAVVQMLMLHPEDGMLQCRRSSSLSPSHSRAMVAAHAVALGCTLSSLLTNTVGSFGNFYNLEKSANHRNYRNNVNAVIISIINLNAILGISQGLSLFQADDINRYCVDHFGFKSPLLQWAEWQISVPFMIYLIITLDITKTELTFLDNVSIVLSFVCILSACSLNWRIITHGHAYILALSTITMIICLTYTVLSAYHKYAKTLKSSAEFGVTLFKNVDSKIAKSRLICALYLATCFFSFPATYFLAIFNFLSPDFVLILTQYLNFLAKICLSVMVLRAHMSVLDPNAYDLEIQERINDARTTLLRYVFHEVRVPLNSISLGLHVVKNLHLQRGLNEVSGSDEPSEVIFMMQEAVIFMSQTLNDILSLQRIEEGRLQLTLVPTNLGMTINLSIVTLQPLIKSKRINIKIEIGSAVPKCVKADVHRIGHVITNLLSNALKFSPEDSTILVVVSNEAKKPEVVTVSVQDEGIGLSAEDVNVIFQPYTQVRPGELQQGRGSGIGLAICKEIVELHDGRISVKALNKGSNFFFTIPFEILEIGAGELPSIYSAMSKLKQSVTPQTAIINANEVKVLIADDVLSNRKILGTLLKNMSLNVEMVGDGVEAIELVTKVGIEHYHLILMDSVMPKMMGTECARQLRKMGYRNLLIGVTGNALDEDVSHFTSCGADMVLAKPVRKPQLDNLVTHITNYGFASVRDEEAMFADTGVASPTYASFANIRG